MRDSLELIDAKLERAEQHISDLNADVEALLDSAPYRSVPHDDPQALEDFQRMLAEVRVPPRISVLAEEAIHHTRSALDHIASGLVIANNERTSTTTQFPIFKYRPSCEKDALRYEGQIRGMNCHAKALIDALQPFQGEANRDNNILVILKDLDNFSKHHGLLVAVATSRPFVTYNMADAQFAESLDDAADFVPIGLQKNVQRSYAAYVLPVIGSAKNQPIVPAVGKLWAHVVFSVSRKFRVDLMKFPWE